jgi:hypothetical protein
LAHPAPAHSFTTRAPTDILLQQRWLVVFQFLEPNDYGGGDFAAGAFASTGFGRKDLPHSAQSFDVEKVLIPPSGEFVTNQVLSGDDPNA